MGTICAPAYANIFMAEFEEKYIYPLIENMLMLHNQYIDNIFMIWKGNYDELTNFVHNINKQHSTIKFDFVISKETVFGHKGSYRQISKYSNHSLQKRDWSSKLLTLKI